MSDEDDEAESVISNSPGSSCDMVEGRAHTRMGRQDTSNGSDRVCSPDKTDGRFMFVFRRPNGEVINFQTSTRACNGSREMAERICRICLAKLENGASKAEVLRYRNQLYKELAEGGLNQMEARVEGRTPAPGRTQAPPRPAIPALPAPRAPAPQAAPPQAAPPHSQNLKAPMQRAMPHPGMQQPGMSQPGIPQQAIRQSNRSSGDSTGGVKRERSHASTSFADEAAPGYPATTRHRGGRGRGAVPQPQVAPMRRAPMPQMQPQAAPVLPGAVPPHVAPMRPAPLVPMQHVPMGLGPRPVQVVPVTPGLAEALVASCCVCGGGDATDDNDLALCDRCNRGFHQRCHRPPVLTFGREDENWFCADCVQALNPRNDARVGAGLMR